MIVDLTIVFTVLLMILLGLSTRKIHQDKELKIDSIFINLQIIMMIHTFYDHFSFGIEVMDHASALQIGQVVRSVFLGTMNLQNVMDGFWNFDCIRKHTEDVLRYLCGEEYERYNYKYL